MTSLPLSWGLRGVFETPAFVMPWLFRRGPRWGLRLRLWMSGGDLVGGGRVGAPDARGGTGLLLGARKPFALFRFGGAATRPTPTSSPAIIHNVRRNPSRMPSDIDSVMQRPGEAAMKKKLAAKASNTVVSCIGFVTEATCGFSRDGYSGLSVRSRRC